MTDIDHPLLEAALENAEVVSDLFASDEVLREIPVVSTALNLVRGVRDLRDRVLAHKLGRFVAGLETPRAKQKMKHKVTSSPDEARRVGETLFLVLERVIDLDKPALLAKVFVAYLDDVISSSEFRRLAQAVDSAFVEDIQKLVEESGTNCDHRYEWKENLLLSGLMRTDVEDGAIGAGSRIIYEVSQLGQLMRKALKHRTTE